MRALAYAAVAGIASLGLGCVTTNVSISGEGATTISTTPSGARVFINGAEVCATTPCHWNEGDGLAHRYHLQVRKDGYQEVDIYLDKELRFFGAFLSVANYRMPRQVLFTLEPLKGAPPPPAETPSAQPPSL